MRPILKTLQTLLLNLNTAEAERTVLSLVEELDIQPSTEFYNQVNKRITIMIKIKITNFNIYTDIIYQYNTDFQC